METITGQNNVKLHDLIDQFLLNSFKSTQLKSTHIIYYLCTDSIKTIEFPENILFSFSILCRFVVQILKVYSASYTATAIPNHDPIH